MSEKPPGNLSREEQLHERHEQQAALVKEIKQNLKITREALLKIESLQIGMRDQNVWDISDSLKELGGEVIRIGNQVGKLIFDPDKHKN